MLLLSNSFQVGDRQAPATGQLSSREKINQPFQFSFNIWEEINPVGVVRTSSRSLRMVPDGQE